jgi:hypothetical protein
LASLLDALNGSLDVLGCAHRLCGCFVFRRYNDLDRIACHLCSLRFCSLFFVLKPSCRLKETNRLIKRPTRYRWQALIEQINQLDELPETIAISIGATFNAKDALIALIASATVASCAFDFDRFMARSLVFAFFVAAMPTEQSLPYQCRDSQSFFSESSIR